MKFNRGRIVENLWNVAQLVSFLAVLSGKLSELQVINYYFIYESVRNCDWSGEEEEQLKYEIVICSHTKVDVNKLERTVPKQTCICMIKIH